MMKTKKITKKTPQRYATHLTTPSGGRVYVSARTKEEFDKKVAEKQASINLGVDVTNTMTFREYAETWVEVYKKPHLRPGSLQNLELTLKKHVYPTFGEMRLVDIKPIHVQQFRAAVTPMSRSVQSKAYQAAKAIFTTAADNGLIVRTPFKSEDKPGGAVAEEKDPLTSAQCRALLDAVSGTRAYLFCLIALHTGMRRGEILGLMWEDVDLENRYIHVRHELSLLPKGNVGLITEDLKSASAYRDLPVSETLLRVLREEKLRSISPFVVAMKDGKPLTKESFRSLWSIVENRTVSDDKKLGDKIRGSHSGDTVSLDFYCHPHLLRHTYITNLFEKGLDVKQVQYLAGHSTPEMTMKVYTHYRAAQRKKATFDAVRAAADAVAG